ncbi:hypothetical protein E2P63_04945 [Candidatus Bathyarchaeota archaeon]|nr:hypothetical protein E2P63_04945 [Candidatus Bathyarchaeota archaeon]
MSKALTLMLFTLLTLSSLVMVGSVFAQSTPKPSVPEFTIKIVSAPYDVPTTHSIDPYTGEEITHPGYHVENKTTQIWIENQAFMPYQIYENDAEWTINLFYNIRLKGAFSQDWFYFRYHNGSSDGNLRQAYDFEYTVVLIDSYLPPEGKVDVQIEALIGYEHGVITGGFPGTPRIITGESSGWSEIQTLTIGESQTSSPEPTIPTSPSQMPNEEPELSEQEVILGTVVIIAIVGAGLGLLLYLIKRK